MKNIPAVAFTAAIMMLITMLLIAAAPAAHAGELSFSRGPVTCTVDAPEVETASIASCAQGMCICAEYEGGERKCYSGTGTKTPVRAAFIARNGRTLFRYGPITCRVDPSFPRFVSASGCTLRTSKKGGAGNCTVCVGDARTHECNRYSVVLTEIKD